MEAKRVNAKLGSGGNAPTCENAAFHSVLSPRPQSSSSRSSVAMTLSSCGFQLRGQAAIPFQTLLRRDARAIRLFANDLERAIRSGSKTRIVTSREEAEAVLQIIGEVQEKQILSLSSARQGARIRTALPGRLPADRSRRRRPRPARRNHVCAAT